MKILVTGGAGFIGSHLVDRLVKYHQVVIVDNLSTGLIENINKKAIFYKADITDTKKMKNIFKKEIPEIVSHCAAIVNVRKSMVEPMSTINVNVLGSLNILECCREFGIKKIIFHSTGGACYGNPEYLPADEKHPTRPISIYGISKKTVEDMLFSYSQNYGLDYTVLRYSNIYGPRQNTSDEVGVISIFIEAMLANKRPTIFGDGSQTRDYLFIDDVINANIIMLKKGKNEIFNVGTGKETSIKKIFDIIKNNLSSDIKPEYEKERKGDIKRISLSIEKIKKFGWNPKISSEEGIRKTIEYYKGIKQRTYK